MKCKIADIRNSKGMKQKFLAEKIGISQQLLSEYERGKSYPRMDRLDKIAKILSVKWINLYEEE